MTRIPVFIVLLLLCVPARAIYKCTVEGTIVYRDSPCSNGKNTVLQAVPNVTPQDAQQAHDTALREKNTLAQIEKSNAAVAARQAKEQQHSAKMAAEHRRHCLALSQRVKWQEEDMAHAGARSMDKAKRHYRRAVDTYATDCKPVQH
jgi:hypothetical protein